MYGQLHLVVMEESLVTALKWGCGRTSVSHVYILTSSSFSTGPSDGGLGLSIVELHGAQGSVGRFLKDSLLKREWTVVKNIFRRREGPHLSNLG